MKSDKKLDEILWSMRWSAAIAPELSMIPGRSVFLCASEGCVLTAKVEEVQAELLPSLLDEDAAWLRLIEGGMPGLGGGDEDVVTTFTSNFSKSGRHTPRDLAIKHSDLLSCPELC